MKILHKNYSSATVSILCGLLLAGCGPKTAPLSFKGALVTATGAEARDANPLETEYLLLYFSAHWCPPCRAFTPKLVQFHKMHGGGIYFQTVLISSDHEEAAMYSYMKETGMPWSAVRFQSPTARSLQNTYSGSGIPRLVLITPQGDIIADSFKGKKYIGPESVLKKLQSLLSNREKDPVGLSAALGEPLPPTEALLEKFTVQGIGQGSNQKIAIINNVSVTAGADLGDGVVVENITDNYVEVSFKGNRYRLTP